MVTEFRHDLIDVLQRREPNHYAGVLLKSISGIDAQAKSLDQQRFDQLVWGSALAVNIPRDGKFYWFGTFAPSMM